MPVAKHPQAISNYLHQGSQLASLHQQCREEAELLCKIRQRFPGNPTAHITGIRLGCQIAILYVDSPAWASRVRYLCDQLVGTVAAREFKVQVLPTGKQQGNDEKGPPPRHSNHAAKVLAEAAECTADVNLRAVLKRLSKAVRE
jgi:hypothetical protein